MRFDAVFTVKVIGYDGHAYLHSRSAVPFVPHAGLAWIFNDRHAGESSNEGTEIEMVQWYASRGEFYIILESQSVDECTVDEMIAAQDEFFGLKWSVVEVIRYPKLPEK